MWRRCRFPEGGRALRGWATRAASFWFTTRLNTGSNAGTTAKAAKAAKPRRGTAAKIERGRKKGDRCGGAVHRLCGLAASRLFPLRLPSRTDRGSKAAKPQGREGEQPQKSKEDAKRRIGVAGQSTAFVAWRLRGFFLSVFLHEQTGEAKPPSRKAAKGTAAKIERGRKKGDRWRAVPPFQGWDDLWV